MSNDPAPGSEQQPGWHGQQPYPGGYGQQPEQPTYASYPQPGQQQPAGYGQAQPSWQQTPGQQRYPGSPPGYPAAPAGTMQTGNEPPNFFSALFDFGFNSFATPVVIKVLYILGLVGIGLGYVILVISAFADSPLTGLVTLIGGAVGALFYVIFFRVFLEFYYAVVRMSEDIRAMRNRS